MLVWGELVFVIGFLIEVVECVEVDWDVFFFRLLVFEEVWIVDGVEGFECVVGVVDFD